MVKTIVVYISLFQSYLYSFIICVGTLLSQEKKNSIFLLSQLNCIKTYEIS